MDTVALIFAYLGVISIIAGIYLLFRNLMIKSKGESYVATIIGYEEELSNDGDLLFKPIVRFKESNNNIVNYTINLAWGKKHHSNNLKILYLKKGETSKVIIDSFMGIYLMPLILIVIGIIISSAFILFVFDSLIMSKTTYNKMYESMRG